MINKYKIQMLSQQNVMLEQLLAVIKPMLRAENDNDVAGAFEDAGEAIDEAFDDAGEAIEDTAEDVGSALWDGKPDPLNDAD